MRVLLAEGDGKDRSEELVAALTNYGATTIRVPSAQLTQAAFDRADVVLLRSATPDRSCLALCDEIRAGSDIPLILVADRASSEDRARALRSGADDCIVVPYGIDELAARIQAVLRRRFREVRRPARSASIGDVTIDMGRMVATVAGNTVDLTKKEFQLLALIADANGSVCSRERLAAELWGRPENEILESLHVLISRLRSKLGSGRIKTVRSIGYQLVTSRDGG
jgi:DNA-binding response OmpR family regulator